MLSNVREQLPPFRDKQDNINAPIRKNSVEKELPGPFPSPDSRVLFIAGVDL